MIRITTLLLLMSALPPRLAAAPPAAAALSAAPESTDRALMPPRQGGAATEKHPDAWRLKQDPLDLRTAAEELSRGGPAGQERLYLLLAGMYASAGDSAKAARVLEGYRLQGGRDKTVLMSLAYQYDRLGAPDEGAAVLEKLSGFLPEDREVTLELARFYRLKGDAKAADALVEARARSNPKDPRFQREAARIRLNAGDYAGAEQALRRALEEQRAPEIYVELSQAVAARGDIDGALDLLKEGGKALPEARLLLDQEAAGLCYRNGRKEKAAKLYGELAARHMGTPLQEIFEEKAAGIAAELSGGGGQAPAPQGGR